MPCNEPGSDSSNCTCELCRRARTQWDSLNKLAAIRDLRQFCLNTFGVTPGLKESTEFIEQSILPFVPKRLTLDYIARLRVLLQWNTK